VVEERRTPAEQRPCKSGEAEASSQHAAGSELCVIIILLVIGEVVDVEVQSRLVTGVCRGVWVGSNSSLDALRLVYSRRTVHTRAASWACDFITHRHHLSLSARFVGASLIDTTSRDVPVARRPRQSRPLHAMTVVSSHANEERDIRIVCRSTRLPSIARDCFLELQVCSENLMFHHMYHHAVQCSSGYHPKRLRCVEIKLRLLQARQPHRQSYRCSIHSLAPDHMSRRHAMPASSVRGAEDPGCPASSESKQRARIL
jgi:hypothetical protein